MKLFCVSQQAIKIKDQGCDHGYRTLTDFKIIFT